MQKYKMGLLSIMSSVVFLLAFSGCSDEPDESDYDGGDSSFSTDYDAHTNIMASTFWCGEGADNTNDFITNTESAWDGDWGSNFGIEDGPLISRDSDHIPDNDDFTGEENPYYFALPYDDIGTLVYDGKGSTQDNADVDDYERKESAFSNVYWEDEKSASGWGWDNSMCKNRWIKVRKNGDSKWCYAQWEDAGPYYYNDYEYVFGTSSPKNTTDEPYAGIDLSPSVWLFLGESLDKWGAENQRVDWTFVDASDVPSGPWKTHVTTRQVNW
jgi:hypothetical protein